MNTTAFKNIKMTAAGEPVIPPLEISATLKYKEKLRHQTKTNQKTTNKPQKYQTKNPNTFEKKLVLPCKKHDMNQTPLL